MRNRLLVPLAGFLLVSAPVLLRSFQAASEEVAQATPLGESDSGESADTGSDSVSTAVPDFKAASVSPAHPIHDVTVYSDRAEVTRESQIKLKPGMQWIHVGPLPQGLDRTSLKVRPVFGTQVKIGQVLIEESFERVGLPPELKEKVDALHRNYAELLARTQKEHALHQISAFVLGIRLDKPFPRSGQKDFQPFSARTEQLQSSLEELTRQSSSVSEDLKREREGIRVLNEKIELARNEIQRFTQLGEQRWLVHLYALVESPATQGGKLQLSYQIPNAKWHPVYDVRAELNRETGTADIRLVTAGMVEQHTGEDWSQVGLALSTLDPVPLFLPKLARWTLAESRQEAPRPMKPGTRRESENRIEAPQSKAVEADRPAPVTEAYKETKDSSSFGKVGAKKKSLAGPMKGDRGDMGASVGGALASDEESVDLSMDKNEKANALKIVAPARSPTAPAPGEDTAELFPLTPLEQVYPVLGEINRSISSLRSGADKTRMITASGANAAPAANSYDDSSLPAVQAGGRLIEFTSPFSVNLKSDDPPYKIPVHAQALRGELTYFAIPKQDSRVYLRANTTNTTDRPILGGSAQIFMDGDLLYVSKTSLSTISEGSYFTVDLGVDRNVQTKRIVTRKSREKGIIKSSHVTDVEVRIELANHHPFPVAMEIRDNYPLVPDSKIQVELASMSPKPVEKNHGLLKWEVKVPARQKTVLTFTYQVTHPENYLVSEFN